MITLPELLKDPRYKKFFCTVPKQGPSAMNWRIYVQRKVDGPWARRDYAKYSEAFKRIKRELEAGNLHDGTIQSRGIAYAPPERIVKVTKGGRPILVKNPSTGQLIPKTAVVVWRPKLMPEDEQHIWCVYCRRPTVFKWFLNHHALRNSPVAGCIDPADRRCTICGAREDFVNSAAGSAARPGYSIVATAGRRRRR